MRNVLMAAASFAVLGWAGAASAQSTQLPDTPGAEQATSTPDPSRAPAVQGDISETAAQEVVVTAERRTTSLQRTGVAATVLTGADLAKKAVQTVDDLQFATPSLTVQNSGQGNQFNIRGVGKAVGQAAVNVGVVTYRDGVATFPGFFQSEPYYDIASVEVLRGPQGTFVGQNATGGAVFITEQNPSLRQVQGYGQVQAGNYDDFAAQGAVNLPLTGNLAMRAAFNAENRDSFYTIVGVHGGHPGRLRARSGRLSMLWQPTDQLRIILKGDYNNINKGGYAADLAINTTDPFVVPNNAPINKARDDFGRIVLNASWTSPTGIVLRSITGYQYGTSTAIGDLDATIPAAGATPAQIGTASQLYNFISTEEIMSEEFNIISPDTGPFTWVLGAYYQYDRGQYPNGKFFTKGATGTLVYTQGFTLKSNAAGFGQVGYEIADGLQIQGGIRYSRSKSHNIGRPRIVNAAGVQLTNGAIVESESDDDAVTGKVALNWTASPNHFFYGFVATGYKSGGLNANATSPLNQAFKPEHVTDFELGWKGTFFDGHLRTQVGGYYNRYKNFQVRLVDTVTTNIATFQNVPSTTIIAGFEGSAQANFGRLSFDLSAGRLYSKLGTFFAADPRVIVVGSPPCNLETGPASTRCFDLSGRSTPYAPKFTGNLGVQYAIPLSETVTLTPRVNYAHISTSYTTLFQVAARGDRLEPRNIVNAQLTLADRVWAATAYVTNATDQEYIASTNGNLRYAGPPRQYGVRLTRNF